MLEIRRASDGSLDSNVATVTITIAANRPPTANPASLTTQEDRSTNGALSANDPDGDRLTFSIVSGPSRGTATVTNMTTGRFTYVPQANANGTDTFTFKVNDGTDDSNVATVTVTITPVNDAPSAADATYTIARNTALSATLLGSDVDGGTLTYVLARSPRRGTISNFNPATGTFSYTPSAGFTGSDSFTFRVSDGTATSAAATVTIRVN